MTISLAQDVGVALIGYALGCIPTGYVLVRLRTGQDVRRLGSGSTGARNVGRLLGRWGFLLTLLGDITKGALALALAQAWAGSPSAEAATLVAVTAGHVWPAPLRFAGGRGVAVALGALLVHDPRLLLALGALTLAGWASTRRFQLAGLFGFALLPAASWWLQGTAAGLAGTAGMCMIVVFAHRAQLVSGRAPAAGARSAGA